MEEGRWKKEDGIWEMEEGRWKKEEVESLVRTTEEGDPLFIRNGFVSLNGKINYSISYF